MRQQVFTRAQSLGAIASSGRKRGPHESAERFASDRRRIENVVGVESSRVVDHYDVVDNVGVERLVQGRGHLVALLVSEEQFSISPRK